MKGVFSLALLIIAVAFFSRKFVFQRKIGLVSLSGLEVYVIGILFSFILGKAFLSSLAPIAFAALAFIGFSFGAQFNRDIVKEIKFTNVMLGFILSLQYFVLFFILNCFYQFNIAVMLATIFSIPSPFILSKIKNKFVVISGEISVVFVLVYYSIMQFGMMSLLYSVAAGALGFLFVLLERVLEKNELYVLLIGFLLLISGISQIFPFSIVFSAAIFGLITAFYSNFEYAGEIRQSLEQPLFLFLLFFAGIFFSPLFFSLLLAILVVFIKPIISFPLLRAKSAVFVPFGALSIAVAMRSMSFDVITFVVISYFVLLALLEIVREKMGWDI